MNQNKICCFVGRIWSKILGYKFFNKLKFIGREMQLVTDTGKEHNLHSHTAFAEMIRDVYQ